MSNIVQGMCYRATFGCPKRKAIAVAMGDHAHDDGSNIWPSVKRLATKVEWSERTVQRVLRELEDVGILIVVDEGGGGPKDTREWKFDMDLLRDLADEKVKIVENKGDSESSLEGDYQTPLSIVRVSTGPIRVTGLTPKGDSADTQTINNHHEPSGARVRASEKGARASAAQDSGTPQQRMTITKGAKPAAFAAWLAWHKANSPPGVAGAMERISATCELTEWPPDPPPQGRGKMEAAGDVEGA